MTDTIDDVAAAEKKQGPAEPVLDEEGVTEQPRPPAHPE